MYKGNDIELLKKLLPKVQPEFVHLDADHTTRGLTAELSNVLQSPYPSVVLVHDYIDKRVRAAFRSIPKYFPDWNIRVINDVFNGAVLLSREKK